MSTRKDIIDGKDSGTATYGLVYSCTCGWIDLGHANPAGKDGVRALWKQFTSAPSPTAGSGYKVTYRQKMSKTVSVVTVSAKYEKVYWVSTKLTKKQKEQVALAIFLEVSHGFETMQSNVVFREVTDSGYSVEDLVSNLIGFYRAVRALDYVHLCKPVSKEAALKVWDEFGSVGSHKNRFENVVSLFPCSECGVIGGPMCSPIPMELTEIIPAVKGSLFREWTLADSTSKIKDGIKSYLKR